MFQQKAILKTLLLFFSVLIISCSGGQKPAQKEESREPVAKSENIEINGEARLLLNTLDEMGDYVNSRNFPSLIKPQSVYEELGSNILILDLRGPNSFASGHIEGAVKVDFTELPDYFANQIKPFEYDKIILICYSGQISSYAASLLRLDGYGNVYSMRWGMSGWNKDFAKDHWMAYLSSDYEDKLETTENNSAPAGDFPQLNTGLANGDEILQERIHKLFAAGYQDALINADDVFANPSEYYIINYERKDKYDSGHVPGAVRYKPGGTLGIVSEMQTIPSDKEIVVYCNTGHNSSFVTAYLRLFGYNAKTLSYGNNSFMYNKMKQEESTLSWLPFSDTEIGNYPYVKN